jgi:hypothetical protein
MIKGIRFWKKKGGTRTTLHAVRLVQLCLFCLAGVLSGEHALSATMQPLAKNTNDQESYPATGRALSMEVAEKPGTSALIPVVETSKTARSGEGYQVTPIPNPSVGMEIIGGLALFFWIQRLRNFSV